MSRLLPNWRHGEDRLAFRGPHAISHSCRPNSQSVSTRDYRSLINYLIDNEWLPETSPLFQSYRFKHLRLKLPTMNKQTKRKSAALIRLYLFRAVLCTYLFKPGFHLHLARRLFGR